MLFHTRHRCHKAHRRLCGLPAKAGPRLCALLLACAAPLPAQDGGANPYRGAWRVEPPEENPVVLIVKKDGRASHFFEETPDQTVYQGEYEITGEAAVLEWEDGSRHRIELEDGRATVTYSAARGEGYVAPAENVPDDALGAWARPPERPEEERSDRDEASGFFGVWRVGADGQDAETEYLFVESDRSTATTWSGGLGGKDGLRGSWAKQGDELHIVWDSGHYTIIRETNRGFTATRLPPAVPIEEYDGEPVAASRVRRQNAPGDWLENYGAERENPGSRIDFRNRGQTLDFYPGFWLIRHGEETYERIKIRRFGGLRTSRNPSLGGSWDLSGLSNQEVFMRWEDGIRRVLAPVGKGFVLREYEAGRPIDGVPNRILPAAPSNLAKLDNHLDTREHVARRLLDRARAAGLEPRGEVGWGDTLTRLVWPFGTGEIDPGSEALFLEEPEAGTTSRDENPWWWPVWSDHGKEARQADEAVAPSTPESAPEAEQTPEEEEKAAPPPGEKSKRDSTKDWEWPF